MKLLPLVGYKSLRAMNALHALLLGLKMLPAHVDEHYEEFFAAFQNRTEGEKETLVREAVAFVELQLDEVEALVSFAADKNGIPYGPSNIGNLGPGELHEIIVAVCMEIGRIRISLVSDAEKKSSLRSPSTLAPSSRSILAWLWKKLSILLFWRR